MNNEAIRVCAEIAYSTESGAVHSDVCPPGHLFENIDSEERKLLHQFLDEWLNESGGTGCFFVGDSDYYRFIPDQSIIPALAKLIDRSRW